MSRTGLLVVATGKGNCSLSGSRQAKGGVGVFSGLDLGVPASPAL